jgi:hypothetical protein
LEAKTKESEFSEASHLCAELALLLESFFYLLCCSVSQRTQRVNPFRVALYTQTRALLPTDESWRTTTLRLCACDSAATACRNWAPAAKRSAERGAACSGGRTPHRL